MLIYRKSQVFPCNFIWIRRYMQMQKRLAVHLVMLWGERSALGCSIEGAGSNLANRFIKWMANGGLDFL